MSVAGTAKNTIKRRYTAPLGRRDRCRGDVVCTSRAQGPGRLEDGCSSGQHIIDQQAGGPADAGLPSRLHLHGAVEVAGALAVVEPGLVGNPAAKPQRR